MLNYIHSKHGRLISEYIDDIDKRMKIPISGETEFEAFVQQIEDGKEAVALQNP